MEIKDRFPLSNNEAIKIEVLDKMQPSGHPLILGFFIIIVNFSF